MHGMHAQNQHHKELGRVPCSLLTGDVLYLSVLTLLDAGIDGIIAAEPWRQGTCTIPCTCLSIRQPPRYDLRCHEIANAESSSDETARSKGGSRVWGSTCTPDSATNLPSQATIHFRHRRLLNETPMARPFNDTLSHSMSCDERFSVLSAAVHWS